jgi:hypothetical protein
VADKIHPGLQRLQTFTLLVECSGVDQDMAEVANTHALTTVVESSACRGRHLSMIHFLMGYRRVGR